MRGTMCASVACATLALALLAALHAAHAHYNKIDLRGKREPCGNEGERVVLGGQGMSCFSCICKNGFVDCREPSCPPVEDCYMTIPRAGCCARCQGCWHNGTELASHTERRDAEGRLLRCEAGVITASRPQCYAPCARPLRTRHTHYDCPVCNDCIINGQHVGEGREVTIPEDPCLKCRCSGGGLTCAKRACAVLPCPPHAQVTRAGECCPRCANHTTAKILPGHTKRPCIMGKDYHAHLSRFSVDACTQCQCVNGTAVCERATCPVVTCDASALLPPVPGKCCARCPVVEEVRSGCSFAGKTYKEGQTWQWDACKSCECQGGEVRCATEMCPPLECGADQVVRTPPGQCCPACVHTDGVCTVFGDPHYKTFDGKFYSFQGSCKYQLVADCVADAFSIRISNDARNTSHSSWTRTVALRMAGTKINLGRLLRVKIDGRRVQLPHSLPDGRATVRRVDDAVSVNTSIGVSLLWDGDGFLEVTVSSAYRSRLCGLCGNFNGVARDDLVARDGTKPNDSAWHFGSSWRVGGRKACTRRPSERPTEVPCFVRSKQVARRLCRIERQPAFAGCVAKLNPTNYRKACLRDACRCEAHGQCHCASFRAYARECRRLGADPGGGWSAGAWCEGAAPPWLERGRGKGSGGEASEREELEKELMLSVPLVTAQRPASRPPRPPPPLSLI